MSSANVTLIGQMTPSDWVGIGTAIVTLLLVIAAFWSIILVRSENKKDRTERIIKDIIDWAEDINKCGLEKDFLPFRGLPKEKGTPLLAQMSSSFSELFRRSRYIKGIILPEWSDLLEDVDNISKELVLHEKHLDAFADDPTSETMFEVTNEHRGSINLLADAVIDKGCLLLKQ